jgi:SAM-dependent methyltransferase
MVRRRIAEGIVQAIKRNEHLHRAGRKVRFQVGRLVPPRRYPGIPGRVHYNDFMFTERSLAEAASYRERALNVISLIEESLAAAGRTFDDVERWLDFGCGYGRVVRFLVEHVPPGRVSASDVVTEGVDFCQSEFGVRPIYAPTDLTRLKLGSFDFIYAISVITHLNERNSVALLRLLGDSLTEGGMAMFTTHGRYSLENPALYGAEYQERKAEIAAEVERRGTAFVPYPFLSSNDYGMAWHSREFIESAMDELHGGRVRPLVFTERGLDDHQDVFAFQRVR